MFTLLSQFGVNDVSCSFFTLTSPFYHCVVSIRLLICSYPQVFATTLPSTHTSPFYHNAAQTGLRLLIIYTRTSPYHCAVSITFSKCPSIPIRSCYNSMMSKRFLISYKSLLPQLCINKVNSCLSTPTSPCCHSGVSITFSVIYLHLPILYATVMSIIFLTTPLHPDVLCYHCTVSV